MQVHVAVLSSRLFALVSEITSISRNCVYATSVLECQKIVPLGSGHTSQSSLVGISQWCLKDYQFFLLFFGYIFGGLCFCNMALIDCMLTGWLGVCSNNFCLEFLLLFLLKRFSFSIQFLIYFYILQLFFLIQYCWGYLIEPIYIYLKNHLYLLSYVVIYKK